MRESIISLVEFGVIASATLAILSITAYFASFFMTDSEHFKKMVIRNAVAFLILGAGCWLFLSYFDVEENRMPKDVKAMMEDAFK